MRRCPRCCNLSAAAFWFEPPQPCGAPLSEPTYAPLPFLVNKLHMDQIVRDCATCGQGCAFNAVSFSMFLASASKSLGIKRELSELSATFTVLSRYVNVCAAVLQAPSLQHLVSDVCDQPTPLLTSGLAHSTDGCQVAFNIVTSLSEDIAPSDGAPVTLKVEQKRRVDGHLHGRLYYRTDILTHEQAAQLVQQLIDMHAVADWLRPLASFGLADSAHNTERRHPSSTATLARATPTGHVLSAMKTCAVCKRHVFCPTFFGLDRVFCSEHCRMHALACMHWRE